MKKLALSLICASAFASNFVGFGFYGSSVDTDSEFDLNKKNLYSYGIYANKFYNEGENNFVYDVRLGYSHYKTDYIIKDIDFNGNFKAKLFSLQALAGYGITAGNDVSVSFLGGLGYEKLKLTLDDEFMKIYNLAIKIEPNLAFDMKLKSMFLKAGVAARKQFENNFTMSGGVYLKYFTKKVDFTKRFSPEVDLSLGYTFENNIYAGVKFGYENTLIGNGGKVGFELGYKF